MLLSDFAMKLGGSGGGHSLAAAARVPKLTCDEVVEKLASRLKAQC
jgi:nanoRNase/pAp phosphatase (c-di-AMP/oligoRNAs hydrolase)